MKKKVLLGAVVTGLLVMALVAQPGPPAGGKTPGALSDKSYTGEVRLFAFEQTPPKGWRECNGAELAIAQYPALFQVIGTRFGASKAGYFKVPDLRGTFVRGWNHGRNDGLTDPDNAGRTIPPGAPSYAGNTDHVGTTQRSAMQQHKHVDAGHLHQFGATYRDSFACGDKCGAIVTVDGGKATNVSGGQAALGGATDVNGVALTQVSTNENRPSNVYLMYCIRDGSPAAAD